MAVHAQPTTIVDIERSSRPLIRWGAVVAGAVWGLALMALLSSLWLALAFPTDAEFVRDNLEWFLAGSGAVSLFVAGLIAGALADRRGVGSGWLHAMTAWGLLLITSFLFGLPSIFGLFNPGQLRTIDSADLVGPAASDAMWATFLTLLVGAVAASLGGFIGGAMPRATDEDVADLDRVDEDARTYPTGRHAARSETAREPTRERVMVSRNEDGSYVDQYGNRYIAEGTARGQDQDAI